MCQEIFWNIEKVIKNGYTKAKIWLIPITLLASTYFLFDNFNIDTMNIDYEKRAEAKKIVKSVFITIPIVWIIVTLLSSADEIFGSIFVKLFEILQTGLGQIPLQNVIVRLILTLGVFIYLACFFDYISSRYEKEEIENLRTEEKEQFTMCLLIPYKNVSFS